MIRWMWIATLGLLVAVAFGMGASAIDWPVGSGKTECLDCHMIHNALGGGYFKLIGFDTVNNLCDSCHGTGVNGAPEIAATHRDLSCTTCHEPHNQQGSNLFHVRTSIRTGLPNEPATVAFEDNSLPQPQDYADGDTTYDGICEVCHSSTTHHRYDGSVDKTHEVANATQTCTACHSHDDGFSASGGSCVACHAGEKGAGTFVHGTKRRTIVGAAGDYLNSVGGHMSGADPTDFECVVCHREGYVDQGAVVLDSTYHNNQGMSAPYPIDLRNVDNATASFAVYNNPTDPSAGSQKWDATSANNLTEFCLRCHDTDGANAVYTTRAGGGGSSNLPFGTGNGTPLDLYTRFQVSNYSSHAINSSRTGLGAKYTADYPTDGNAIMSAAFVSPWSSTSTLECADCHLGQQDDATPTYYRNAHGGRVLQWLLRDKNGLDKTYSPARTPGGSSVDETTASTIGCFACHEPTVYAVGGSPASSRFPTHNRGGHPDGAANTFAIGCMNCHGGYVAGGIHGTNLNTAIDDNGSGAYPRYRFTNGASLDYWSVTATGQGRRTCSSQNTGTTGNNLSCTKHPSTAYKLNYGDNL